MQYYCFIYLDRDGGKDLSPQEQASWVNAMLDNDEGCAKRPLPHLRRFSPRTQLSVRCVRQAGDGRALWRPRNS